MEENILGFSISVLGQNILVFNQRLKDFNLCVFIKFHFCYFFNIKHFHKAESCYKRKPTFINT